MLSQIRLGLNAGIIRPTGEQETSVYALMMAVQPACLQQRLGKELVGEDQEKARADFLRISLPDMEDGRTRQN